MSGNDRTIIINGIRFSDVTNQTVVGKTYNYEEAVAHTNGQEIVVFVDKRNNDRSPK